MELATIKEIVLTECAREKKITIRNLFIILFFLLIISGLVYTYALPQLTQYLQNASTSVNTSSNYSMYYKFAIPIAIILSLFYPLWSFIKVLKRAENAALAFEKIAQNSKVNIVSQAEEYLTVIPLGKIKINLNPINYLYIVIDNKSYQLPVNSDYISDIKIGLSGANTKAVYSILNAIYSDEPIESLSTQSYPIQSMSAFNTFADKELKSDIEAMEGGRSKSSNLFYIQAAVAVLFMVAMISITVFGKNISQNLPMLIGGIVVFIVVFSLGVAFFAKKTFKNTNFPDYLSFKKHVFQKLIKFVNPHFEYIDKGQITVPELLHSGMFIEKNYKISGTDQIFGVHSGVPFQSCNLTVSFRPNFSNEKDPDDIVFYGNYFVARFNKTFQSPIYIYPKNSFIKELKENDISLFLNTNCTEVKLEDPEFSKQFKVYCDDQVMARYVLTPTMMERLKEINARSKGDFHIAINDKNIVLANNSSSKSQDISGLQNSLFTKIDMKLVQSLYQEFTENLSMIETLKLNNNIWK